MSTLEEEEAQLPSYEVLSADHRPPSLSPEARRLFWTLDRPLADSVWIMKDAYSPDSIEPYFCDQTWHLFSQSPLTEPKVSSITVHNDNLDEWEDCWLDCHRDHSDSDCVDENGEIVESDGTLSVRWGDLPDYDPGEDENGPKHLLICCGTKRPRGKTASVTVKPTATPFVTVHDYLSTVHPWLLSSRDDLLAAMGLWDDKPRPAETKLMINYIAPDCLTVEEQAEWIHIARQPPNPWVLELLALQQGVAAQTEAGHGESSGMPRQDDVGTFNG
ncbi:hypothetical protein EsH8_X_000405 [Colletotrichum jinshuiense]